MQHYELTFIIPMSYTIDEVPGIIKKVKDLLGEHEAKIVKEESMGKLKFTYPIKKMTHGYYQICEFDVEPSQIASLNRQLTIMNEVTRFLLVKKRIKSEKELAAEAKLREKLAKQAQERKSIFDEEDEQPVMDSPKPKMHKAKAPKAEVEKEKVAIEDLDKRLDSILDGEDMIK